jgi:hypothetical protein
MLKKCNGYMVKNLSNFDEKLPKIRVLSLGNTSANPGIEPGRENAGIP